MEEMTIELFRSSNHFEIEYEKAHWAYLDGLAAFQKGYIKRKELQQLYDLRLAALEKSQHYFQQHFTMDDPVIEEKFAGDQPIPLTMIKEV
jgi:hypothetical protein